MHVSKLNGIHIHHAHEGPEGAPAMVFSNSLGTDFRVWDRVAPAFRDRFRIIRYDKRGHGLSDAPPAPYRMDEHVGDLAALLDLHGVSNAIVVGLSVGGLIAQGLIATRPDLVRALVLTDTAHKIGNDELWNDRIGKVTSGGIGSIEAAILERWFTQAFRTEKTAELAGWRAMLTRTPTDGYAGTSAAIRDTDYTETTKAIAVPTLCICGTDDGSTPPELVRSLSALIQGSRYAQIDGAGHLPCVEAPERFIAEIEQFLRDNDLG